MADEQGPAEAPAEAAIPATPPPRFVGGKPRSRAVPLEYPVEYEGKVYSEVIVQRLTAGQVDEFYKSVRAGTALQNLPMFSVPYNVIEGLDADDAERVEEAALDFLPQRLRRAAEQVPPQPDNTPPSSPKSSDGRSPT